MASYNRVVLVGNVTRDIEVRYLQNGTAVTDIGMAINDRRKNQQGEWVEDTTFVDVTLWGRTAEVAGEYLGKGSPILIEGRLKLDTWETDGQKRSKLKVVGEKMQMLSSRGGGGGGDSRSGSESTSEYSEPAAAGSPSAGSPSAGSPSAGSPSAGSPSAAAPQDDIPF